MDIFEYTDYRKFLLDRIEFEKLTFERFAKKYPKHLTVPTLKKLLGRNRINSSFVSSYNMSNERFTELLYELRPKLTEDQIYRLALIKIVQEGSSGEPSKLSKLIKKRALVVDSSSAKKERFSTTAVELALEGISLLPQTTRKTLEKEFLTRLVTNLMRFSEAAEVVRMIKKIRSHITR